MINYFLSFKKQKFSKQKQKFIHIASFKNNIFFSFCKLLLNVTK